MRFLAILSLLLLATSSQAQIPTVSLPGPTAESYLIPYSAASTVVTSSGLSTIHDGNLDTGISNPLGGGSILVTFPSPRFLDYVEAFAKAGPSAPAGQQAFVFINFLRDDGTNYSVNSYDVAMPLQQYTGSVDLMPASRVYIGGPHPAVRRMMVRVLGGTLTELRFFDKP